VNRRDLLTGAAALVTAAAVPVAALAVEPALREVGWRTIPESYVAGMWCRTDGGPWKHVMEWHSATGKRHYWVNLTRVSEAVYRRARSCKEGMIIDSMEVYYAATDQQLAAHLRELALRPHR
jgi:hypothetical protein